MTPIRYLTALALLGFTASPAAVAGAWTQAKGGLFAKVAGSSLAVTDEFDHRGRTVPIFAERSGFENASYEEIGISVYLEYGATERLTLIANVPWKRAEAQWDSVLEYIDQSGQPRRSVLREDQWASGVSDLTLSARWRWLEGPLVLSTQTGIKIPLDYDTRPANGAPPLGTGETDYELHLLAGRSFARNAYVSGSLGYRSRGGPLEDELLYSLETGMSGRRWFAKLAAEVIQNRGEVPDLAGQPVQTPIPGGGGVLPTVIVGDQDVTKLSPSVSFEVGRGYSIVAEAFSVVDGKNTVKGTTYALGIVLSR